MKEAPLGDSCGSWQKLIIAQFIVMRVEMKRSGCEGKGEFRDDVMFSSYSLSLILPFVLKEVLATINSIM